MKLDFEENQIYEGKSGRRLQMAMGVLVAVGEVCGAKKMTKISSAHVGSNNYQLSGDENIQWLTEFIESGAHFGVYTTLNPCSIDMVRWRDMGVSEKLVAAQRRLTDCYLKLGAVPTYTCLPYMHGYAPRFGERFSSGSSGSMVFINSVFGGAGNREGGPAVTAAAITGKAPEYGMHFAEERQGQVIIDTKSLDLAQFTLSDYSALGWYVGTQVMEKTPVFPYIPSGISQEQLRFLLSSIAGAGLTAIVHIVGITPEAPSLEAAFVGRQPEGKLEVRSKELKGIYEKIRTASDDHVDLVAFGCPHCSYSFIQVLARILEGKKINSGVRFWVSTSECIRSLAKEAGLVGIIERAGGLVLGGMCIRGPYGEGEIEGVKVVATNTANHAFSISSKVDVIFGNTRQCINAAIKGRWGDE